jgi:hypothetical protein
MIAVERGEVDPPRVVVYEPQADGSRLRRGMTGPQWRDWERQRRDGERAT